MSSDDSPRSMKSTGRFATASRGGNTSRRTLRRKRARSETPCISLRRSADKKAALLVHRAACIFLVMLQQAIFATAYRRFLYAIFTPFQRFILPFAAGKCNPDLHSPLCATMIRGSCGKRKRVFRRGGGRGVILPAIVLGLPRPQARKNGERRAAPRFPYFAAFFSLDCRRSSCRSPASCRASGRSRHSRRCRYCRRSG